MSKLKLNFKFILFTSLIFLLASCTPQATPAAPAAGNNGAAGDEDHGDEDHGDEDHGDEDHGDEDHGDEDHGDEDHGDEDHGDEDHSDEEHREHGAHEHGTAELSVALIDGEVEIALETPAYNLVGFEYEPSSDEEKAAYEAAVESLEKGEWFTLSDAAGCSLDQADVINTLTEEDHDDEDHDEEDHDDEDHDEEDHDDEDHDEEDHDEEGESHSSFLVNYTFTCTSLENLEALDATVLFTSFPNFEEIDAQWLNDTQQSAATLDKDQPVLSFE